MTLSNVRHALNRIPASVEQAAEWDITELWVKVIRVVLSLLIFTILVALTGGVIKTFLDIRLLFSGPVEVGLRQVIVDTLILLAVVEVFKTTLTYLSEGRVKVTFIVDTILVVMLTEIISIWFKDADLHKLMLLGGIVLTLGVMRVVAVRCSPTQGDSAGRTSAGEGF
ncbi:MAG: phosphate-starvation-inducible PsiE family protein [Nitrospiraceae bacterium]|nr:phosphate-starvation-inducible PsiE family protein [Nitrospiraceae bacterium]